MRRGTCASRSLSPGFGMSRSKNCDGRSRPGRSDFVCTGKEREFDLGEWRAHSKRARIDRRGENVATGNWIATGAGSIFFAKKSHLG